jgi:hypothetical protein
VERTLEAAAAMLRPEWDRLREADPTVEELFDEEAELVAWLAGARDLLAGYFSLEDPTRLEPAERERLVEVVLPAACGCAASWTGSTGRRAATCGSWTTRPGARRARCSRARRCSR